MKQSFRFKGFSSYFNNSNPMIRFVTFVFVFVSILVVGSAGYIAIEGVSPFDALYMTLISVTTVGFGEVFNLSDAGRIWTMVVIVVGMSYLGLALSQIIKFIVEGELMEHISKVRNAKEISNLEDHVIICGMGRTGLSAYQRFREAGVQCVFVESDQGQSERQTNEVDKDAYCFYGDATQDSVLKAVGIDKARLLIAAAGNDMTNLFLVLSARNLNPKLKIIARVSEAENTRKMKLAGASDVICLYTIAGKHMAEIALRTDV